MSSASSELPLKTMISSLAEMLGTSEPALLLTLTLLIGYPFGLFYNKFLYGKSPNLQHIFFTLVGLFLNYYNYGADTEHSIICILVLFFVLLLCGGTLLSVGISFIFFMMYLLTAYFYTSSRDYDIKWTLPHCVITLRLIALAFNVYDGTKKFDQLSEDQKKTALHRTPSLLEISGYCYFFGGFMVGPQFSMTQYLSFVHKRIPPNAFSGKPSCFFCSIQQAIFRSFGLSSLSTWSYHPS
ncbi:LPCAT3 [Cordylochernes scorpioides]|uniref:Lysophospholipid acyltransferase 5 n=1 Tax=Cordylochernes scorpioides TaxID=51811 RepID=A0ABY6KIB1_9ARAC|nr:LPCAT3 [Cordylochernes scorpioides]